MQETRALASLRRLFQQRARFIDPVFAQVREGIQAIWVYGGTFFRRPG